MQPHKGCKAHETNLFQKNTGLLQLLVGIAILSLEHSSFSLVHERMCQAIPVSRRLTEIGDGLTSKLIGFTCTIETQQAKTRLLGNLCRLIVQAVTLKDGTTAIEEQQSLAEVPLCCVNLGDVQFLSRYGDLLPLLAGEGGAGLFV